MTEVHAVRLMILKSSSFCFSSIFDIPLKDIGLFNKLVFHSGRQADRMVKNFDQRYYEST